MLATALDDYDVILIDCQPSLGLLTVNALTASDGVIVPLECEYFALRGVALLKTRSRRSATALNLDLRVIGLLGTMFDGRTLHGREVLQTLVDGWGDAVFHTVIRRTVKFSDSTVAGEPITEYASTSPGAEAYRQLAREVLAGVPTREPARCGRAVPADRHPAAARRWGSPRQRHRPSASPRPGRDRPERPGQARREDDRLPHQRRAPRDRAGAPGAARALGLRGRPGSPGARGDRRCWPTSRAAAADSELARRLGEE